MASIVLAEFSKLSPKAQNALRKAWGKPLCINYDFIQFTPIKGGALSYKFLRKKDKTS